MGFFRFIPGVQIQNFNHKNILKKIYNNVNSPRINSTYTIMAVLDKLNFDILKKMHLPLFSLDKKFYYVKPCNILQKHKKP